MFRARVDGQLERLCASAAFARSERMVRFLRFIVEQSLLNCEENLRERQIGILVFERSSDWDPKLDNIVRSEARRLRSKLEAYAASASPDETIRITVPKGAYFAKFQELQPATQHHPAPVSLDDIVNPPVLPVLPVNRHLWFPGSLLVLTAMSFALFLVLRPSTIRRVDAGSTDSFEITPISNEIGQQFSPAISPDGSRIAYVWDGNGSNYDIYVKSLSTGTVSRLTHGPAPELHPTWSPDGSQVAFLRHAELNDQLVVRNLQSGSERVLTHVRDTIPLSGWASNNPLSGCQNLSWSPNGRRIVLADSLENRPGLSLVGVDLSSGAEHQLTTPPLEDEDCYPRISPDGETIAFVRYISHGVSDLFTIWSDGSHEKQLTQTYTTIRGLDWSADGKRLIYASQHRGSYELRQISSRGGESHPIPADTSSASDPMLARDGRWMAFVDSAENWNIWRVSIQGDSLGRVERVLASSGHNHSPSLSPDGTRIAFVSDRSGSPEIWFASLDGSHLQQMTHFGGPWLGTIRWSPNGRMIVFDARPNGHAGIFSMSTKGGNPTKLVQGPFEARRPFLSRDGRFLYFDITRTGAPQIWRRDLQTGDQHVFEPRDYIALQESLNGESAYFSHSPGDGALWSSDTQGTHLVELRALRPDPVLDWSVGAQGIFFTKSADDSADVYFYAFRTHTIHILGHLPQTLSQGTPSLAVSNDGHWLYYAAIDSMHNEIKQRTNLSPNSLTP